MQDLNRLHCQIVSVSRLGTNVITQMQFQQGYAKCTANDKEIGFWPLPTPATSSQPPRYDTAILQQWFSGPCSSVCLLQRAKRCICCCCWSCSFLTSRMRPRTLSFATLLLIGERLLSLTLLPHFEHTVTCDTSAVFVTNRVFTCVKSEIYSDSHSGKDLWPRFVGLIINEPPKWQNQPPNRLLPPKWT